VLTAARLPAAETMAPFENSMFDPRLCSVHLQIPTRRDDFRRARQALIGACGQPTLALDRRTLEVSLTQAPSRGARPPSLRYWLVDREFVYALKVGLNTIGRKLDNDVAILDDSVSRRHAAIVVHVNDGCELHDTASKNGTRLNGERIAGPLRLQTGDEIRLCDRLLVFVAGNDPPAPRGDDPDSRTIVDNP
jgi:hypothetical protein